MAEQTKNLQSSQVIAKIFGVSVRRVEQLNKEKIIKGEGSPLKFDLLPTIKTYIKYLSEKANSKVKSSEDSKNESKKLDGDARYKDAKAEIYELKLKELKGEMHKAEDVEDIMTDHVLQLRAILMSLPGKLAVDCAASDNAAEVAEIIKREVYRLLKGLSEYEYDAEAYKRRVKEREGWGEASEE